MTTSVRSIRLIALAVLLPLGLVAAASCAPPPTCPVIKSGTWSGTWASTDFAGLSGDITANLIVTGSSLSGNATLTGIASGPVTVTGAIDCKSVSVTTSDGLSLTGTASAHGTSITGTYVTSPVPYHGTFKIRAN